MGNKIAPFLWFETEAEEAAKFYTSIFENSQVTSVSYYGDAGPGPKGLAMVATFRLAGQEFMGLNFGPGSGFRSSAAFYVKCATQAEVDHFWEKLAAGGELQQCGWLKDKFGVSWNIVPTILPELLADPDPARAHRVMQAMLQMKKLDIAKLKEAHDHA